MVTILILEFLFFSFVGWIIDSGYRSFVDKKWVNAGYFKGLVCPIYGFGALVLIFLFKTVSSLSLALQLLIAAAALVLVEYLGGIFTEKVLKLKLWDYSSSKFHLGGHIDLRHSFYWFALTAWFYFVFYPLVLLFETSITFPEYLEFPILVIFTFGALWLTIRKMPAQFFDIHGKMMNITVEKYKEVYSNLRKMYRATSTKTRKKLQHLIQQQLKNTNASLKKINFKLK